MAATTYITLVPAYGRDYKNGKEVQTAWDEGKDFRIEDMSHPNYGAYMNNKDATPGMVLNIRYKKQMNIKQITIK